MPVGEGAVAVGSGTGSPGCQPGGSGGSWKVPPGRLRLGRGSPGCHPGGRGGKVSRSEKGRGAGVGAGAEAGGAGGAAPVLLLGTCGSCS